jgi:hypothetical protein
VEAEVVLVEAAEDLAVSEVVLLAEVAPEDHGNSISLHLMKKYEAST